MSASENRVAVQLSPFKNKNCDGTLHFDLQEIKLTLPDDRNDELKEEYDNLNEIVPHHAILIYSISCQHSYEILCFAS